MSPTDPTDESSDLDLARRVAGAYVEHVVDVTPMAGGLINDTYLVTHAGPTHTDVIADASGTMAVDLAARRPRFVLQRLNPTVFDDADAVMANIVTAQKHLGGAFVPPLLPTRNGVWSLDIHGACWRAFAHVTAVNIAGPDLRTVASAAMLLARFHDALDDLDPAGIHDTIPHFHDPAHRLGSLRTMIRRDPVGRAAGVQEEIGRIEDQAELCERADDLIATVPVRVAHNDTKLANFLFTGDRAVCLVDLDTLMATATCWDVADLVRSSVGQARTDPGLAPLTRPLIATILDAYRNVRPTGDELETATVCLVHEQAMRYLSDHLDGDRYFHTDRPGHNLERARAQLDLLEMLRETFGR